MYFYKQIIKSESHSKVKFLNGNLVCGMIYLNILVRTGVLDHVYLNRCSRTCRIKGHPPYLKCMGSNPTSVSPFFPPLIFRGTACGETYVSGCWFKQVALMLIGVFGYICHVRLKCKRCPITLCFCSLGRSQSLLEVRENIKKKC